MVSSETINTIKERLLDDESKLIFDARLKYYETHDYAAIVDMVATVPEAKLIRKRIEATDCYVYGSGFCGKMFHQNFPDIKIKSFVESNPKEESYLNFPIIS